MTSCLFFFNATATTEIYTLSLHDALPICNPDGLRSPSFQNWDIALFKNFPLGGSRRMQFRLRSEEHTSELQSRGHLVCRLLLEKKKQKKKTTIEIKRTNE